MVRTLLRCASCRFAALYCVPFCAGLAIAGRTTVASALWGAAFWIVECLAIEVTNRIADRREDAINRPERTQLCERVGWARLARLRLALWGAVVVAGAAWALADRSVALAALLALGCGVGIGYSHGPRFARRPLAALLVLSGPFVGPLLIGWAAGSPAGAGGAAWPQLRSALPLLGVAALFSASLAGIKDITDRDGDRRIGYDSAFVRLLEGHGVTLLVGVAAAPFAATVALVAAGALPPATALLLALLPVSLTLALAARNARERVDQLLVREAFYAHWLGFASLAVLAFAPSAFLACCVLGGWAYWALATRYLHWSGGMRVRDAARIVRLAGTGANARTPALRLGGVEEAA